MVPARSPMREAELQALLAADERHWWYRGRRRVLAAVLDRLELPRSCAVLDAGCGSGRTMEDLARLGRVTGFDFSPLAVESARARGHGDVQRARLEEIPHPDDSFDLITCLDVVEHTPDDVRSLSELRRVAKPGGVLVATVPAYQLLWSDHDVANEHVRRYRWGPLRGTAVAAGWEPVRFTYFNSILLPPAAAVRLAQRLRRRPRAAPPRSQLHLTPSSLDPLLELPMRMEAWLIRRGARLPAGLSLLGVFCNPQAAEGRREAAAGAATGARLGSS
jgi:SAM-dependent methyltransferase